MAWSSRWMHGSIHTIKIFAALIGVCMLLVVTPWGQDEPTTGIQRRQLEARLKGPLAYNDPDLLKEISSKFLLNPPPDESPVLLTRDKHTAGSMLYDMHRRMDYTYPQLQKVIKKIFKGINNGFFVEAGAVDGEFLSNTLDLEIQQNWTGLLVEADGDMFHHLRKRGRHVWSSHCCLSPHNHPQREVLLKYSSSSDGALGKGMYARGHNSLLSAQDKSPLNIVGSNGDMSMVVPIYESVQCLPLASLLLALGRTHVDFISLDVEGVEPQILSSFPWGDITVDVWLAEHLPKEGESVQPFIDIFTANGYVHQPFTNSGSVFNPNYLFFRKGVVKYQGLKI